MHCVCNCPTGPSGGRELSPRGGADGLSRPPASPGSPRELSSPSGGGGGSSSSSRALKKEVDALKKAVEAAKRGQLAAEVSARRTGWISAMRSKNVHSTRLVVRPSKRNGDQEEAGRAAPAAV